MDILDSSRNPVLRVTDYFVKTGEAIALAVFFRIAADNTDSLLIEVVSIFANCAVGAYAGTPIGILLLQLDRIKTRKLWVALGLAGPFAVAWAWASFEIGRQISDAVKQIASMNS